MDHLPARIACATMLLLATAPIAVPVHAAADPWLIAGSERLEGIDLLLDRPLVILPGGDLMLDAVHVRVEEGGAIEVQAGGALTLHATSIERGPEAPFYPFLVLGRIDVADSHIEGSEGIILRGPATAGSKIHATSLTGHASHAVQLTLRAQLQVTDSLIAGNGHQATTAASGIRVSDATLTISDSVFLDNAGWSLRLVATSAGSELLGPSVARVHGNIFADGEGGIHIQGGEPRAHQIHGNLLTDLVRALNLQGPGYAEFSRNTIVGNQVAASNYGHIGTTEPLNGLGAHVVDLGDSWLGPAGPVWEGPNSLHGAFDTNDLLDEDPVQHLWARLEAQLAA